MPELFFYNKVFRTPKRHFFKLSRGACAVFFSSMASYDGLSAPA
jgi:hypothetical protein